MSDGDSDAHFSRQRFSRRALVLGGVQAAGIGVVGGRLFNLQIL